jgi:predicted  nucleic acid-binding Zn-ribbon protein
MTKAELELRVQELEQQLENIPDENELKDLRERRKNLTQEVFDANKKIKILEETIQNKDKVYIEITNRFNDLASLFDDYIKGFDDVIATNKLFLRTANSTKELLEIKIKKFNGSEEGGTE